MHLNLGVLRTGNAVEDVGVGASAAIDQVTTIGRALEDEVIAVTAVDRVVAAAAVQDVAVIPAVQRVGTLQAKDDLRASAAVEGCVSSARTEHHRVVRDAYAQRLEVEGSVRSFVADKVADSENSCPPYDRARPT